MLKELIVLGVVFGSLPAFGAAFTLACRGGENTSIHWIRGNWPAPDKAYFTFFKTRRGHNADPVEDGQCAWLDRRVRWNEPSRVCLENVGIRSFTYEVGGEHLATNWDAPTDKRRVLNARLFSGNTFRIRVENDNNGCLRFVSLVN